MQWIKKSEKTLCLFAWRWNKNSHIYWHNDVVDINIKYNTNISALLHKKRQQLYFIGCKIQLMFHFVCVSELLGSAKKVNVNFQDTDGWVAPPIHPNILFLPLFLWSHSYKSLYYHSSFCLCLYIIKSRISPDTTLLNFRIEWHVCVYNRSVLMACCHDISYIHLPSFCH